MAKGGSQSIEEYIDSQHSKGFSKQEIVDRMKKSGYDDEVISIAYKCSYQQRWIIALSVVCVILVAVSAFALTRSQKIVAYGVPAQAEIKQQPASQAASCPIFRAEPASCMGMDGSQRADCLKNALESLDSVYKDRAKPGTADYFVYSQEMAVAAALLDDPKVCNRLSGSDVVRCVDYIPYMRATIGKDVASCQKYADDNKFLNCYTESLRLNDPSGLKDFAARFGAATKAATETGDLSGCDKLNPPRISSACKDYSYQSRAMRDKDLSRCDQIEDASYQSFCRSSVSQVLNPTKLPVALTDQVKG